MLKEVDLDLLELSPFRKGKGPLRPSAEEVESLRAHGVLHPLCARPISGTFPQRYELVGGETTWMAAQLIGLSSVPVFIREDLSEAQVGAVLKTEDAASRGEGPLSRARAIQRLLLAQPSLTRSEMAGRLGMTLSNLSHHLRLLELPREVQALVEEQKLKYGHARALLGLEQPAEQIKLARLVARRSLSVRVVEAAVRALLVGEVSVEAAVQEATARVSGTQRTVKTQAPRNMKDAKSTKDANIARLEATLGERLGSPVEIDQGPDGQGALIIHYHNLEILEGIIERLGIGDPY